MITLVIIVMTKISARVPSVTVLSRIKLVRGAIGEPRAKFVQARNQRRTCQRSGLSHSRRVWVSDVSRCQSRCSVRETITKP